MSTKQQDELNNQLLELWQRHVNRKISESQMRRKMNELLESNTVNSSAQNRRAVNDFMWRQQRRHAS